MTELLPGDDKQHTADTEARQQHVHPDVGGQRVEEGEHPRVGAVGFVVQDADSQRHEGLGEVDHLFPHVCDSQRGDGEVGDLTGDRTTVSSDRRSPTFSTSKTIDQNSRGR